MNLLRFFIFLCLISASSALKAQEEMVDSCPCEDCPQKIEDGKTKTHQINIFNIQNGLLSDPGQCVKEVGIRFRHDYVGDIDVFLISPAGDEVHLIGPAGTFSTNGGTSNANFNVKFIPDGESASPGVGINPKWHNDQPWNIIGDRTGSYYPYEGQLQDFNRGRVNGPWTLRVTDDEITGADEGNLIDFYVEFCDSEGLVCDPCLDPEDNPTCIFMLDPGEATVVPEEEFCIPIYAKNVAFFNTMQFLINWDPTILRFSKVDSLNADFLLADDFLTFNVNQGDLTLNYTYDTNIDNLGLVVADSTAIFNVCFEAIGTVGDSTLITVDESSILAIDVDGLQLFLPRGNVSAMDGLVKIAVDSTADCVNAIQLCGNEPISIDKTNGAGFDENEFCADDPQEFQAKWFRFDILEAGTFEFIIQPKGEASYGFSLNRGGCPNDDNYENVECMPGLPPLIRSIGIANNPSTSFNDPSLVPTDFASSVDAKEGETYFLLIDNFSKNGVGFNLEFAGTAKIGDLSLQAKIADPAILNCNNPTIELDASASTQGAQYMPVWSTDTGRISTIDLPIGLYDLYVDKGGTFTFTITDKSSGCISKDSVFVSTDMVYPIANANEGGVLNCTAPMLSLSSNGSSAGEEMVIDWDNLNIEMEELPGTTSLPVEIGGQYELKITNTENGCFTTDTVEVIEDFIPPQISTSDNFISCRDPIADLEAVSTTPNVNFEWTGGNLINPIEAAAINANDTGTYFVLVTAPNGCTTLDSLFVVDQRDFPQVEAGDATIVNCDFPNRVLDGTGSSEGPIFQYEWTTNDGEFLMETDTNSLTPTVVASGIYTLKIVNTDNGCISEDSVFLDSSFVLPKIIIEADSVITCFEPELTINAIQSDSGSIFSFEWIIGEGANILNGQETYQPIINQPGEYTFSIKNTENGCVNEKVLSFDSDDIYPEAFAGQAQTINCNKPIVSLDGEGSSIGNEYEYQWNTQDGHIIEGANELVANVDSAGLYIIKVTNKLNGCATDAQVTISKDFVVPDLSIPTDTTLTCRIPTITLTASTQTDSTQFLWFLPTEEEISTPTILAQAPGKYKVSLTAANGCINYDSLILDAKQVLPNIVIADPDTITCTIEEVTINANTSDQGAIFENNWSTINGIFQNENQSSVLSPIVREGGWYYLEMTNSNTGCMATDSILVPSNVDRPVIEFVDDLGIYSCANREVFVKATSNVPNAIFKWKFGENELSNTEELTAGAPGVYTIIVTNPDNQCSKLVGITIEADTLKPKANAGLTKELNCSIGSVELNGDQSDQGDNFIYLWTSQTNDILSDSLVINATKAGLYNLVVVNQNNGCRSVDTVSVTESRDNPIADAGPDTIFCSGEEEVALLLGGPTTSKGDEFLYSWYQATTNIPIGDSIAQLVSTADTLIFRVVNTINSCESADTVRIVEKARPQIAISKTGGIDCQQNEIRYLASSDLPTTKIKWVGEEDTDAAILIVTDALLEEEFVAFGRDTLTGCLANSDVIRVMEDRILPMIDAGEDRELNCSDTLRLPGRILSADIMTNIEWRTDNGNLVGNRKDLNPIVDAAGSYILTIENKENFCISEDTIFVTTDQILPAVVLKDTGIITCSEPIFTALADTLSTGENYFYSWKTEDNKFLTNDTILEIDLPGVYQLLVIDSSNLCTQSDFITILTDTKPPEIDIEVPSEINCLNNEVTLHANVNIEDGRFLWTVLSENGNFIGDSTEVDLLVNAGGTYEIEVINKSSGCSGIKNITVDDIRKPIEIDAGSNKTITCFNDTTVLASGTIFSDTSDLVFEWTADIINFLSNDSTLSFNIKQEGTYFLKVIDTLSFCETIDSFIVDKNINPIEYEIGTLQTLDCINEEVIVGNTSANNDPDYTFLWRSENGIIKGDKDQPTATATTAGHYILFIESKINGCTFVDSQTVISNKVLPIIDIGLSSDLNCLDTMLIIGGDSTDVGEQYNYNWTTEDGQIIEGESSPFAIINKAGIYQLEVTNTLNNCVSTDGLRITANQELPNIELPNGLSFSCTDETISVNPNTSENIADLTFHWSTTNGNILSGTSSFRIELAAPGTYFIETINRLNNCRNTDTLAIKDNRALPLIVQLQDQMLGCNDRTLSLSAEGSASGDNIVYEWFGTSGITLSNNSVLTVDGAGEYVLQITNRDNSCISLDTVQISENINPPKGGTFFIEPPSCEGINNGFIEIDQVLGGTGPYSFQLDLVDTREEPFFSDLAANNYILTIIDDLDCEWDTTILLNQPNPLQVDLIATDEDLLTNEPVTFSISTSIPESEIEQILWTPQGIIDCIDCTTFTTSFLNNTTVGVKVIDKNGCEGDDSIRLKVDLAPVPDGITPNGDGANDVFIIPAIESNPTGFPNSELIVFNRWGDILYRASPYNNDWGGTNKNGQLVGEGTYYYVLRLNTSEGELIKGDITILRK